MPRPAPIMSGFGFPRRVRVFLPSLARNSDHTRWKLFTGRMEAKDRAPNVFDKVRVFKKFVKVICGISRPNIRMGGENKAGLEF